jgi:hypothetical protein
MFQFPRFASSAYVFNGRYVGMTPRGFPHSGIHGSQPACGSPWLFAACHALLRFLAPRHPPSALPCLTTVPLERVVLPTDVSKTLWLLEVLAYAVVKEHERGRSGPRSELMLLARPERIDQVDLATLPPRDLLRKEVIQPQVPLRLPCYDFTPITDHTFGACPPCGLAQRLLVPPAFVV